MSDRTNLDEKIIAETVEGMTEGILTLMQIARETPNTLEELKPDVAKNVDAAVRALFKRAEEAIDEILGETLETIAKAVETRGLMDGKHVASVLRDLKEEHARGAHKLFAAPPAPKGETANG